jgi:ribonuclease HI
MIYYSVHIGKNPGIYQTWDDCKKEVIGHKNAKYKKFKNLQDAEFFKQYGEEKQIEQLSLEKYISHEIISSNIQYNHNDNTHSNCNNEIIYNHNHNDITEINVYTDGSCINNGNKKIKPKAGIGIYFGPDDPRNVSKKVIGKQTNNVAEITAIIHTICMLRQELEEMKIVNIYTDSKYSINCCTDYGTKLEQKNWITKDPIPNVELVKKAYNLCKLYKNVKLHHVKAHTGKKDVHSVGNHNADRLANEAVA